MQPRVFDIIFAGGGATACVVAGRLATIDPSLKILVIEGGQHSRDVPHHIQPCRYVEHLDPSAKTLSRYVGKPSSHLNGRSIVVSCGRSVGGGSTVNFMLYVRGAQSDYDEWAALGNNGWSFNELLPYIRKLETFAPISERQATHGYSGPVKISAYDGNIDVGKQFLDVAAQYDPGRLQVDDNNDFATPNAYSPAYRYINPITGRRSDAASSYLYPHTTNQNLEIVVGKRVKRVVIENGRAVGVEYVADPITFPGASGEAVTVKANKLVVISAGAMGSPSILERSGVGAAWILGKNDVSVLIDLPGVGQNYQDHLGASWVFYGSDETETMNDVWHNPEGLAGVSEWEEHGTGNIAHNGMEAILKVRLTEAQLTSAGPALQQRWKSFFQEKADKPIGLITPFAGFPMHRAVSQDRKVLSVIYAILYPESSGSVHITSGDDANSPPDFDPDFLCNEADVAQLTLLYKMSRELIRRIPAYRGEEAALHPQFPAGSLAACKEYDIPAPIDAPDIAYSAADDEAIANFHRDKLIATWHSLGTCAMKPRNQGGVVDARLNVYGVEGLKIADMSICPTNVGNNTYSTALLIGEKAADIITEDLGYVV